jgi:hypothetical protein
MCIIGLNILFHISHILLALKQKDTQMQMAADNSSLLNLPFRTHSFPSCLKHHQFCLFLSFFPISSTKIPGHHFQYTMNTLINKPSLYVVVSTTETTDRTYFRCFPNQGVWNRLRYFEGVRDWRWLCSVTLIDFS